MFFHIKVWLGVILFGIVTALIWVMQPTLINQVAEEQDRLRPILHGQRFERKLLDFYEMIGKKSKTFAKDTSLRKGMSGINYDADDHLSKVMSYQEVHKDIFRNFKAHTRLNKGTEKLFVVSRDGRVVFRSNRPEKFDFEKDKLPNVPHANDALQGRSRTGIWNIDGESLFVASAPVYSTKKKNDIVGAVLYARTFNNSVFSSVKGLLPKGGRVVLFTATKNKAGEPNLAPIAYNVAGKAQGFVRGWFKTKAYDFILEKYYNGMNRDLLKSRIQEVDYTYMVGVFPADLSPGNIGYTLLSPIPNRFLNVNKDNFFESGGPRIIALVGFILVFLLGTWLSGAEIFYFRIVLPRLQTAPQDEFPDIPEKGLSGDWRKLAKSINKIFSMIRERGLGDSDMKPTNTILTDDDVDDPGRMALSYLSDESDSSGMSDQEAKEFGASFLGLADEGKEESAPASSMFANDPAPAQQAPAEQQQAPAEQQAPVQQQQAPAQQQQAPAQQQQVGLSPEQQQQYMQQMYAQMSPEQQQHFSQMAPDQQQQYLQQYIQMQQQQAQLQQQYMQQMYAQMSPEQQQHFSQMAPDQQQQYLQQYIQMQQQYAQQQG